MKALAGLFVALCASVSLAQSARAQVAPGVSLELGAYIRVSTTAGRLRGPLVSIDADSLRIRRDDAVRAWGFSDIQRLEVRGGRDRRRGFSRGAAVLSGIAVVFGGIDLANDKITTADYIGTIATNALIGGAIGLLVSPRGWRDVPLLRRP